jgi:hypothetical protein
MPADDLSSDMRRHPIDDLTAERLLAGAVDPDDAPPAYAQVAALVQTAKAPASADELVRRDADVSAVAAALTEQLAGTTTPERTRMISRRFGAKALAIAIPALALTATGAAAATGSLPGSAQSAVHGALAHVGVSVPSGSSSSDNRGNTGTHAANNANAVGPDANGPAKFGLCRAYAANNGHMSPNSVAFRNLVKEAGGAAGVASFCAGVMPGNSNSGTTGAGADTNSTNGPPASNPGSGHTSTSTPNGPPASTPGSDHTSTSTPDGPPASTPGSDHTSTSTPDGPPASTPARNR